MHRLVLAAVVPLALLGVAAGFALRPEVYKEYTNPGRQYTVVIYRYPSLFAMPGQSGDGRGKIVLRRNSDGRTIGKMPLEMVQLISRVEWQPTFVDLGPVGTLPLPN